MRSTFSPLGHSVDPVKRCSACRKSKSIDEFHRHPTAAFGRTSKCKSCVRQYDRARREGSEVHRSSNLLRMYGISVEDYDEMHKRQGGACAICGEPERATRQGKPMRLAVDHNHTTGRVRELLCMSCNHAIGKLRDNPQTARRLAEYLEKHHAAK